MLRLSFFIQLSDGEWPVVNEVETDEEDVIEVWRDVYNHAHPRMPSHPDSPTRPHSPQPDEPNQPPIEVEAPQPQPVEFEPIFHGFDTAVEHVGAQGVVVIGQQEPRPNVSN